MKAQVTEADAFLFLVSRYKEQCTPRKIAQFAAHEAQLADTRTIFCKLRSNQRKRFARIFAAHFQQAAPVERPQRHEWKIAVMHVVWCKGITPEERLSATIGPPAIEPCGERERVAGFDAVYCEKCRVFGSDAFGELASRARAARIGGDGKADRQVGEFYRIDFPKPEQMSSTASVAV